MKKTTPLIPFAILILCLIGFLAYKTTPADIPWADPIPPEYSTWGPSETPRKVKDMRIGDAAWVYSLWDVDGRAYAFEESDLETYEWQQKVYLERTKGGFYATLPDGKDFTFIKSRHPGDHFIGVKLKKPTTADGVLLYPCSPGKVDTAGNIPVDCSGTITITPAEPHAKHGGPTTPCMVGEVAFSAEDGLFYVCLQIGPKMTWTPMEEGDSGVADNNVVIKGNTYTRLPVEKNQ